MKLWIFVRKSLRAVDYTARQCEDVLIDCKLNSFADGNKSDDRRRNQNKEMLCCIGL